MPDYAIPGVASNTNYGGSTNTSIYASNNIVGFNCWATSDNRITPFRIENAQRQRYLSLIYAHFVGVLNEKRCKTNIIDIEDDVALNELRKLQPKIFDYIDNVKSNYGNVYGFIAQDVEKVIPYAVNRTKDTIPNIFEMADLSNGNMVILRTKSTALFNADADGKDTSGNSIKIKVYDEKNREYITTIVRIIDDTSFEISDSFANSTLFVYGQEVSDFRHVLNDAIYTMTVAALQQIDREYQVTKQEVVDLKIQLASVLERLAAAGIA